MELNVGDRVKLIKRFGYYTVNKKNPYGTVVAVGPISGKLYLSEGELAIEFDDEHVRGWSLNGLIKSERGRTVYASFIDKVIQEPEIKFRVYTRRRWINGKQWNNIS